MQFFGKSDTGMKRRENQDSFITEQLYDNAILCLVCDGMGGANGGSIASALACEEFVKQIKKKLSDFKQQNQLRFDGEDEEIEKMLIKAVSVANTTVFKKAAKNKELVGMGTTLVAALIADDNLYTVNVGDSRLYLINKDSMKQLTRDHSYVQALIDMGQLTPDEAANNPHKNIITKAIGTQKKESPDVFFTNLSGEMTEYLLLCSDGLTNYVKEDVVHSMIKECTDLEECCTKLIEKANENGGGDNITVVLIKLDASNEANDNDTPSEETEISSETDSGENAENADSIEEQRGEI